MSDTVYRMTAWAVMSSNDSQPVSLHSNRADAEKAVGELPQDGVSFYYIKEIRDEFTITPANTPTTDVPLVAYVYCIQNILDELAEAIMDAGEDAGLIAYLDSASYAMSKMAECINSTETEE